MIVNCQTMVGTLKTVLVKRPQEAYRSVEKITGEWRRLGYPSCPDLAAAEREHEAFVSLLRKAGAKVHFLPADDGTTLDSLYTHDPAIITRRGAILCRMGKSAREGEPRAMGDYVQMIRVPIAGRIEGGGLLEGGDVVWLDEETVAVGEGYRTNREGIRQMTDLLAHDVREVITVPLPHNAGPDDCLHLQSLISLVDRRTAIVHSPLLPVPFRQFLLSRGFRLLEVPPEEYLTLGCNVLAVAPGKCILIGENPKTGALLASAGISVETFEGRWICRNGSGGPTCLTRPLLREVLR